MWTKKSFLERCGIDTFCWRRITQNKKSRIVLLPWLVPGLCYPGLKGNQVKILNSSRCCKYQPTCCHHTSLFKQNGKTGIKDTSQKTCQTQIIRSFREKSEMISHAFLGIVDPLYSFRATCNLMRYELESIRCMLSVVAARCNASGSDRFRAVEQRYDHSFSLRAI